MLKLTFPTDQLEQEIRNAQRRLDTEQADAFSIIEDVLIELAQDDFRVRAAGGVASGIRWEPLSPDYAERRLREGLGDQIGLIDGDLLGSVGAKVDAENIDVFFAAPWADWFAERRPLLPEGLPPEWEERISPLVNDWMERVVSESFG